MKKDKFNKDQSNLSRRKFIAASATAAAGITIVPSNVIAGLGYRAPSDKLNIAGVGVGGAWMISSIFVIASARSTLVTMPASLPASRT